MLLLLCRNADCMALFSSKMIGVALSSLLSDGSVEKGPASGGDGVNKSCISRLLAPDVFLFDFCCGCSCDCGSLCGEGEGLVASCWT